MAHWCLQGPHHQQRAAFRGGGEATPGAQPCSARSAQLSYCRLFQSKASSRRATASFVCRRNLSSMSSAPAAAPVHNDDSARTSRKTVTAHARKRSTGEASGISAFNESESDQDGDLGMDDVAPLPPEQAISATARDWKKALDHVIPCVVAIKFMKVRSFDTNLSSVSIATGFVVDKRLGLLLTNRHVVTPGPVRATGTFHNREMLTLKPVYYDPVHDFGFYRFNPAELKFMQLDEVPLAPEAACVGLEVRLIGNDTGEKVSILAATVARLDRDAPSYSSNGYNDFNTFYIQAASNSKGGSSGSPVIDCHGRAVGLNAGGKVRAASAFYLPLHRVVRALELIQKANPDADHDNWNAADVPRGDLQTSFVFKGFDEVRRLGMSSETEKWVRETSGSIGMLVVHRVVPGSPADGHLEPGDVLVTVQDEVVTHFLRLEEILDDHVGQPVKLRVERGSTQLDLEIEVTDMHSVTPSSFVEVGRAIINSLSYQQAHNHRVPTGSVYVADSGDLISRAGVPRCAIITSLNNQPTPDLESFMAAVQPLPHGARVPLEYYTLTDRHITKNCIFQMDRQWHAPPTFWQRDNSKGLWHLTPINPPPEALPEAVNSSRSSPSPMNESPPLSPNKPTPPSTHPPTSTSGPPTSMSGPPISTSDPLPTAAQTHTQGNVPGAVPSQQATAAGAGGDVGNTASVGGGENNKTMGGGGQGGPSVTVPTEERELLVSELEEIARCCLVQVDACVPHTAVLDGVARMRDSSNGVVVYQDESKGLVLVDRFTVPISSLDITITFMAYPVEVRADVQFMHPLHNFAFVSYNTRDLPEEARQKVRAAELKSSPPLQRGDSVRLVVLTRSMRLMSRSSNVTNAAVTQMFPIPSHPRFRPVHEELVLLDQDFGTSTGVLMDTHGYVRAVYASYKRRSKDDIVEYCAGLPVDIIEPWVKGTVKLGHPSVRVLNAELETLPLAKAAQHGLPRKWVTRLHEWDSERRQVLRVFSCLPCSDAALKLKPGDMLLEVDGQLVSSFRDVERIIRSYNPALADDPTTQPTGADPGPPVARTVTNTTSAAAPAAGVADSAGVGGLTGVADSAGVGESAAAVTTEGDVTISMGASGKAEGVEAAVSGCSVEAPAAERVETAMRGIPTPPQVQLLICRAGELKTLKVGLSEEDGMGTRRMVQWCGTLLQPPHRAIREVGLPAPLGSSEGVYIALCYAGSPAAKYSLFSQSFITELNGVPIPDLDAFLKVASGIGDGQFVRVKLVKVKSSKVKVLSLQTDSLYWPTWGLEWDHEKGRWQRTML